MNWKIDNRQILSAILVLVCFASLLKKTPLVIKTSLLVLIFLLIPVFVFAASNVTLEWDANSEADLAGYKVYYKVGSPGEPYDGTGAVEGDSPVDVGNVTTFTLNDLTEGNTYYFVATAYDTETNESDYSNEVFKQIESEIPDTIPPDAPTNLIVTISSSNHNNLVHCTFEEGDDGWGDALKQTGYDRDDAVTYAGQYSMRVFATGSPSYLSIDINPVDWNLDQYPYIQFAYKIPNGVPVGLFFQTTEGWVCLGGTSTHSHGSYAANDTYTLIDDDAWHVITVNAKDTIREVYPTVNSVSEFEWFTFGVQEGDEFWFDEFMILLM